jgi:acrylyl-CoA reductase (NADPH)
MLVVSYRFIDPYGVAVFKAIVISKQDGVQAVRLADVDESQLPEAAVTVRVDYSSLNYKDGLAITGKSPVVRKFPMVPGIDLAGVVESTTSDAWQPGDRVLLNGWGVGEAHWGGFAQKARVSADWLQRVPQGLTTQQAMAIGTAGYTASLCVDALMRHGLTPGRGEVLVTGASGGVGSVAIALLAHAGFNVVASTGKASAAEYLKTLGARGLIDRKDLTQQGKPLQKERWAAVVDSVGSHTLANACAQTSYRGLVAACGLAQGMDFPATMAPFILRGISLLGIDSVMAPREARDRAWDRLARDLDAGTLERITAVIGLSEALNAAEDIVGGRIRGRVVVDVNR